MITRQRQRKRGPSKGGGLSGAEVEEEEGAASVPRKLASKSSFTAFFSFLAINMMPATPNPSDTHMFAAEGEEDGMPLSLLLLLLQRVVDQRSQELREREKKFSPFRAALEDFLSFCISRRRRLQLARVELGPRESQLGQIKKISEEQSDMRPKSDGYLTRLIA